MYVTLGEYEASWTRLVNESLSHSTCKIVVYVSCLDVDALCATKIVSNVLQKGLVPHKIVPVVGYESLRESFQQLDADISNVICVGCGANVDLEDYLGADEERFASVKIHVIDNHRPWNLSNLFGSANVLCYGDDSIDSLDEYRVAFDFLADPANENENSDSDDSQDEGPGSEGNATDTEEERPAFAEGPHRLSDVATPSPSPDQEDEGASSRAPPEATQQDTVQQPTVTNTAVDGTGHKKRKTLRLEYAQRLLDYYSKGSYLSSSDTIQVYTLLAMIGETSSQNLWLTIVGVTALEPQYPEIYTCLYPVLKDEVNRLNTGKNFKTSSGQTGNDLTFSVETDYSFFLLRQWSLYESMVHSPYISAKLFLWTEDGRKNLRKMLAQMGISLQEAKEQWTHVYPPVKRSLKDKLESISGMYGIDGIMREGVIRRFGYKGSLSAGDCAEALAALLEAGNTHIGIEEERPNGGQRQRQSAPSSSTSSDVRFSTSEWQQFWVENFWVGWDSLENYEKLIKGIRKAKVLQQAVVSTGTAIFEKGQLKDLHSFRLAVVRDCPDIEIYRNPLTLARLGVWISEGCAEIHVTPLPLVVAVHNEAESTYLVLGIGPRKSRDESTTGVVYNRFGQAFQETANSINARISIDAFESAIIEVSRDDLARFLEALAMEMRKR